MRIGRGCRAALAAVGMLVLLVVGSACHEARHAATPAASSVEQRHLVADRYQSPGDVSMARVPMATVGGVMRPVLIGSDETVLVDSKIGVMEGHTTARVIVPFPPAFRDGAALCVSFSLGADGEERDFPARVVTAVQDWQPFDLPIDPPAATKRIPARVRGRRAHAEPYVTPPIMIAPGARLRFALGVATTMPSPPAATFTVTAVTDRSEERVFSERVDPNAAPAAWHAHEVELVRYAGRAIQLRFESALDRDEPCSAAPLWADPTIVTPTETVAAEPRRSVLLISLDTLRADRLGCYGYARPTSPTIDGRLAARGTVLEHAYAAFPSTTASHMTLFTSLQPCVHRVLHPAMAGLRTDAHLLAEYLRAAGYDTAAFTEDTYLLAQNGFRRGFDTYMENTGTITAGYVEETFGHAVEWIEAHPAQPWFAFVHTYQVHAPYMPPPGYRERVGAADDPSGNYDGEIRYTDEVLTRLLDAVEPLARQHDALVILTSDHGEQFGEHGLVEHGNSLYDVLLHVPLVLYAPGLVPEGSRVADPVGLIDVVPTVLELLGLPPPAPAQGRSFAPLLRGEHLDAVTLYAGPLQSHIAARTDASTKWIVNLKSDEQAVYDPLRDPDEEHDTAAAAPPDARERLVADYFRRCARLPPAGSDTGTTGAVAIPPAVREKLRALGYAQ